MVVKNFKLKTLLATLTYVAISTFSFAPAFADQPNLSISLRCAANALAYNKTTTCTLEAVTNSPNLGSVYGVFDVSNGISVTNFQPSQSVTDHGSNLTSFAVTAPTTTNRFYIGTITIKTPNTGTDGSIQITNVKYQTTDNPSMMNSGNSSKIDIHYKSNNNNLQSISLSSGTLSPAFSPETKAYNVLNFNSSSISFNVRAASDKATVTGNGTVNLACGDNTHTIKVTAEDGSTKSYTIYITRHCDTNNSLRSLTVSAGTLSPRFSPTTTSYKVNVGNNVSKFTATGYMASNKSTLSYSPAQTIQLVTGTNILKVNVKSEAGITNTYTIYINKAGESGKDGDSSLNSLEISGATINFNRSVYDYKVTVPYETPKVTVKATSTSGKANVKISELGELAVGENKVTVTVTAENGAVSTYTITIVRQEQGAEKLDNDSSLIALIVNDQYILVDPTNTSIKVTIQNVIQKINVVAVPSKTTSSAKIVSDGDMIGDQDIVRVIVTAEDGSTTTYILNFTFPYKTATIDVQEQKPINYILIIIVAVIALAIIGVLMYLTLTTKNGPKTPTKPTQTQNQSTQNYGRWYNN